MLKIVFRLLFPATTSLLTVWHRNDLVAEGRNNLVAAQDDDDSPDKEALFSPTYLEVDSSHVLDHSRIHHNNVIQAYAKIHNCYEALISGYIDDALVDMTAWA